MSDVDDIFIDTYFENGSPLRWEQVDDNTVYLEMIPDCERFSPNRQLTHWNFKVHVPEASVGRTLAFAVGQVTNVWNGRPSPALGRHRLAVAYSSDGRRWATTFSRTEDSDRAAIAFDIPMESPCVQVARNAPYTESDLQRALEEIGDSADTRIYPIGATVEGRPVEMVEQGRPDAPHRVLLRARAHPWESGTSWFVDGMMRRLAGEDESARRARERVCFCTLAMANKDGVYRGMTRFNVRGIDLNRGWHAERPADPQLAPENACLQNWLSEQLRRGQQPNLAICLHNDASGKLHFSNRQRHGEAYWERMLLLEEILRRRTWFTEERADEKFSNPGSFGEGMLDIYGIDGLVYELNAEWAEGLGRPPLPEDWQQLGADFVGVVDEYFQRLPS